MFGPGSAITINMSARFQVHEIDGQLTLQVEGRLSGAWVAELEQCWQAARVGDANRQFRVDLKGVTCIDQAGRYLLRLMHREGVSLVACSWMIQDILEQTYENNRSEQTDC